MIYLIDNVITGHHKKYEDELSNIEGTKINNQIKNVASIKKNVLKAYFDRKIFINNIVSNKQNNIFHFLYLDNIYKCPFISHLFNNKKNKFIGTLHWIPDNKIYSLFLKMLSKKFEYIVVHSEYLKEQLNLIGINNVKVIDYPSFINIDNKKNAKNDKIIISCLGGTRYDKGLDILCEAFNYIDDNAKEKIIFNICGKEQDIKYSTIKASAIKNNIEVNLKNEFLSEEEYEKEIVQSDVILLPYRKIFKGNSGPMTDGVYLNKYILGPDNGNLAYLITRYKLGDTFEQENPVSLGEKINKINKDIIKNINKEYSKSLSVDKFIQRYSDIYTSIM